MDKNALLARFAMSALLSVSLAACGTPVQIRVMDPEAAAMDTPGVPACSIDEIKMNATPRILGGREITTECRPPVSLAPDKRTPPPLTAEASALLRQKAAQACRENRKFCFHQN